MLFPNKIIRKQVVNLELIGYQMLNQKSSGDIYSEVGVLSLCTQKLLLEIELQVNPKRLKKMEAASLNVKTK